MPDKCKNCGGKETLLHILNYCKTSLDQGRFTWRHDNILNYVYDTIDKSKFEIYVDLEEKKSGYASTIPPEIMVTKKRYIFSNLQSLLKQISKSSMNTSKTNIPISSRTLKLKLLPSKLVPVDTLVRKIE